ncbi:MAG: molybdopterin-dependent oxidoreductase, partial [Planctomycetota bacterium]|nr:molybdopterin-dependent oxidoreductase [Planctomycetota bacterium]
ASRLLRTVCAVPTGLAAREMYGKMLGVAFEDYVHAKLIVVWGTNPHATGIHLVPHVQRAQKAGTKLVVVDPRRTKLAKRADLHLPVRPGADLPLALSVIRWLFREGRADEAFLARHATGADALRERAEPWTFERAAVETGIDAAELERFAALYADSTPAVVRCGWGLERNRNGGSAASAVMALPAVAGKFGLRGGGYTMSNSAAWELDATVAPEAGWGRPINMNLIGRELAERDDPPIAVLFVYNANPLATLPNQERVRAGLEREDLFTVVFDQVMTDTARYADVVLPATTFLEHTELRRGYGSTALQMAGPVIEPVGESRPNYAVFADLAKRLDLWREDDVEEPRALARAAVGRHADAWRALEEEGIAHFSKGAANGDEPPVQFVDVFPNTPDRKVHLFSAALDSEAPSGLYGYAPDPGDERHPLALISPATARTISSSFGQLHPARVALELHADDAAARGIADGDDVRVFNGLGEVRTAARVTTELRPGVVVLPKGLWSHNTSNGNTSNALVPDTLTDIGGGACFNDARVEVERLG